MRSDGNTQASARVSTARRRQVSTSACNSQSQATSGQYCWGQSIPTDGTGYDQYGNLLKINSTKCSSLTLNVSVNGNNRVTNTGFSYDNTGNMLTDGVNTYTWEAHARLQSAAGVTYTYDGDGKRVMKSNGTLYWFGDGSAPLAETDSSGNVLNEYVFFGCRRSARRDSSGNVYYYFADHLRTARISTTSSGTVCYDADFYPFGGEMLGTNTCPHHYKFTGDERDSESGLDHTHYRKYASNVGRWLTPDAVAGGVGSGQTWNRSTYALNSPTTLTDPSGLMSQACYSDPACRIASNYGVGPLNPSGAYIPPNAYNQISFAPNSPCNDPWYAETHAECGPISIDIPINTQSGGGTCRGTVSNFPLPGSFDFCKDHGMYFMQMWSCDDGGDKGCCLIKQGAFESCCRGYGWTPYRLNNGRSFYTDCCSKTKKTSPTPGSKPQSCPGG